MRRSRFLTPAQYVSAMRGGLVARLSERDVTVAQVAIELLQNNPNRIAWEMVNNGAGRVDFTSRGAPTAGASRPLGAAGGFAESNVNDDMDAVTYQQQGISAAGNNVVHITEILADFGTVPTIDRKGWRLPWVGSGD